MSFTKEELRIIESALWIYKDEFLYRESELEEAEKLYEKVENLLKEKEEEKPWGGLLRKIITGKED